MPDLRAGTRAFHRHSTQCARDSGLEYNRFEDLVLYIGHRLTGGEIEEEVEISLASFEDWIYFRFAVQQEKICR